MCLGDECGGVDRRTLLTGAAAALVSSSRVGELAGLVQSQQAPTRVLDDPKIQHGKVRFSHGGVDTIDGYLARPKADGRYPGVLVIAGNRITEEYIPNTCAALAVAGFVGLAPNIFHPVPDSATTMDEMRKAMSGHTDADTLEDINSGAKYLEGQPFVGGKGIGVVGFCYGGRMAMLYGAHAREVEAVVPFHPGKVTQEEIARLRVPVQVHCGTADRNVPVAQIEELERMLKQQSTPVDLFWYEGADHGFLAYTRPFYRPDFAKLAWSRVVEFLHARLG
jgi:carboxymethylenebutenolidase